MEPWSKFMKNFTFNVFDIHSLTSFKDFKTFSEEFDDHLLENGLVNGWKMKTESFCHLQLLISLAFPFKGI